MKFLNETSPLLPQFERETWRSKAKRTCLRIPTDAAIPGIIFGLFLVIIVFLIVLENLEKIKQRGIPVDNPLIGSLFNNHEKAENKSWQDMKLRNEEERKQNDLKWDKANEGRKKLPDISEQKGPSLSKNVSEDTTEVASSLLSLKWDELDDEWRSLSKRGWKDKEIRDALFKVLEERKEKLKGNEGRLQSLMNFHHLWDKINDSWEKKIHEGWKDKEIGDPIFKALKKRKEELKENKSGLQSVMNFHNLYVYTYKINDNWEKKIIEGFEDENLKEAVYKALKDGDILLQSAVGDNNMKRKREYGGWKKIPDKGSAEPTRCPFSKVHRGLLSGSAVPSPPIDCALIAEEVRREFGRCIDLSLLPKSCKPLEPTECFSSSKYRKIEAACNNKIHPTWGKSGRPFIRMIAPDYADGVSTIRTAKDGGPLPNARLLSFELYSKKKKPDCDTSVLSLYFGLFVDHDMIETDVNSAAILCCEEEFKAHPQNRPKECLQIDVLPDDSFYGPKNVTCLNLVRSFPVTGECGGRREQMNKATSYLDGSAIYGSTVEHSSHLRTYSRGQLRTQIINDTPFMISAEGSGFSCGTPSEPLKCFEAGDSRVNMMVELTAMHTLWYREHNRIATELHDLNPHWQEDTLFQETRRIVIAELQHITYKELLPILLGEKAMEEHEIKIDERKEYEGYDDTIDATVFNVFGSAAYRFGHSLVPDMLYLLSSNNSTIGEIPLHETFFSGNILYHDGLDLLLRGAAAQRTHTVDSYITTEVREHLFQPADSDYGHDLAAVGILRGRDHGLPSYIRWRSVCGLPEVKTWHDLYKVMSKDKADTFKSLYQSVEDIDLIPGALAEYHEPGSLLGPTYTCLIGRQFKKTRKGDRFWFEIQNEFRSFTKGQLDQIYKSNMARLLCDNSDNIKEIQRHPFKVPSHHNPVLDCDGIQKVDLTEWAFKF